MNPERVQKLDPSYLLVGPQITANRPLRRLALPSLRLRMTERRSLLFIVDLLLLNSALLAAIAWRTAWIQPHGFPTFMLGNVKWFLTLSVLWWLCALLFECYDLARAATHTHSIIRGGFAVLLTIGVYLLIPWLTPPLFSRGVIYVFAALAVGGIATWRGIYAFLFAQPSFQQRALVLGAGKAGQALAEALQPLPAVGNPFYGTGYKLVGFFDDDPSKQGELVQGIPVLGCCSDLPHWLERLSVDEIVVAITHRHMISQTTFDILLACREQGFPVTTMATLYERLLGRVPVQHVGRDLSAVLPLEEGASDRLYRGAKILEDVCLGILGMTALAVVVPAVALANQRYCPGPLFYRQIRVGQGGKPFCVYKFRTMVPDAERETGAVWSADGDPRITPVGRWLRRLRLDELPQILNVLRGEMSVIGPRPERPEFVERLAAQIPFYRARHAVKPGLTGWAQVCYRYGNSVDDSRIKLEYDLYYVKHISIALDAQILLKTVGVIARMAGH